MPLRPSADEWRVHLARPGKDGGCAAREVWTGHPSTLDALWDARAMLRPQTTDQVDPHQVTSDFAVICDRLMAKPAMKTVTIWACPRLLWSITLGTGHHEGSSAFVELFRMLC
eukprot:14361598-Heterocapsa_arctica.AAC.1